MGFEKFHIFPRNPKVLAYSFTENCQFGAKTDQNAVFLCRDPRISIFMGFEKFNIYPRNPKVLAHGFTKNCHFGGKNRSKLRISWSRPLYYKSVIYNGSLFQFLRVLKNFTFLLEIQRC